MIDKFIFDNERWLKDVNNAVKTLRYSTRTLAKKVGLSSTTLHRILKGKYEPRMSDYIQLCSALELVAIEYFDVNEVQLRMF